MTLFMRARAQWWYERHTNHRAPQPTPHKTTLQGQAMPIVLHQALSLGIVFATRAWLVLLVS